MHYYASYYHHVNYTLILTLTSIAAIIYILQGIGLGRIFRKAGEPMAAAFVPFYNKYILYKITWGNGVYFLLLFIPVVNFIAMIVTYVYLVECFGEAMIYVLGFVLLPFIFFIVFSYSEKNYNGNVNEVRRGSSNNRYENPRTGFRQYDNPYADNYKKNSFCTQCGNPIELGSKFCSYCGKRIDE